MSRLNTDKLHVRLRHGAVPADLQMPRRYTLTHSDLTGDLFLVIGAEYDRRAISGLYTRLMRDEVLAEWLSDEDGPALHVYCHVSGGFVLGAPGWRNEILHYHMPQVLQALRYGDQALFDARPELDQAPVFVHFRASQARYHRKEAWGVMGDHRLAVKPG
ncbi:MAG: staygreen family protein [Anaerolineales bacterium]|nr:staygreen family protein [Anaerolineales bacterium]